MRRWERIIVTGFAAATLPALAPAQQAQTPVAITGFQPPTGALRAGDVARSHIRLRGTGAAQHLVWVGYSLQRPDGQWVDIDPIAVTLEPGANPWIARDWRVPPAGAVAGAYRVVMAAWSARPDAAGAVRLASIDRRSAFIVRMDGEPLPASDDAPWFAAGHRLGRGAMRTDRVLSAGEGFHLVLGAGSCDGAELRSRARYHHGTFTARLRTPDAPGSISAFFLFGNDRGEDDEIDIELYNDGSRRGILTAWRDGRRLRSQDILLPFDPAAALHDYGIAWEARSLVFTADGAELARWQDGYPRRPMRVILNTWWPTWLECSPLSTARHLIVERIGLPQ